MYPMRIRYRRPPKVTGERYVDDHTASEYSENAEERELGERMDFRGLLDDTAPLDERFADGE